MIYIGVLTVIDKDKKMNFENLKQYAMQEGMDRFVVGAVIEKDGKVLLLKRPMDDFMPGILEFPSGKVEMEETLLEALNREVEEETGLKIKEVTKYLNNFDYTSKSGKKTRQFNFSIKVEDGDISLTEHDSYEWVDKEEMKEVLDISNEVRKVVELHFS